MKPLFLLMALLLPVTAAASETANTEFQPILKLLQGRWPTLNPTRIQPAAKEGLLELVLLDQDQVLYVSDDGKWLFPGPLIRLEDGVNHSGNALAAARFDVLNQIDDKRFFQFPAEAEQHRITIVTDIDCGYCRQLHTQMDDLNDNGISVRYLMMPRTGPGTESFNKAVAAACAADPEATLTRLFRGESASGGSCEHDIDRQYALARQLGISRTPTIISERSGATLIGYRGLPQLVLELQNEVAAD